MTTPEPTDLERALDCADTGEAGHWPSVAAVLAHEYREQFSRLITLAKSWKQEAAKLNGLARERAEEGDFDAQERLVVDAGASTRHASQLLEIISRRPCRNCNGHGEIGGLLPNGGGYDSEPCPDCNP